MKILIAFLTSLMLIGCTQQPTPKYKNIIEYQGAICECIGGVTMDIVDKSCICETD